MISFDNSEVAFRSKTNKELKKAYILFKVMSKPWIVKSGNVLLNIALLIRFPINWIIKPTIYSHFVGGETIGDCQFTVHKLAEYNVKAILDYSVEGKESTEDIEAALQETLRSIKNAGINKNIPFAVFKPTAFTKDIVLEKASKQEELTEGEKEEYTRFKERIDLLCKTAHQANIPILIDAEDYAFQNAIDEMVTEMMEKYNKDKAIVYNTLQMYRWDRLKFLKESFRLAEKNNYFMGVKLVRGAYMEKERERAKLQGYLSPIHPDKESTDNDYNEALRFSIEHIHRISIFNGTHNEYSSALLTELMKGKGIDKNDNRIFFSQLYGMSDQISFNLAKNGYNVAKYVPYGPVKFVMPYLLRRAEENTSVAGQTSQELELLKNELTRRKAKKYDNRE